MTQVSCPACGGIGPDEAHIAHYHRCTPVTHRAIGDVLNERGSRYGRFMDHARVTQALKHIIAGRLAERGIVLAPDQQETLDMVCHKIGRIVNGDPDYDDSWTDIAGYAQLVADRLNGVVR